MSDYTPGLPTGPLDLLAKAALAPPDVAELAWRQWRENFSLDETPWNQVRMLASVAPRLNWLERDANVAPRIQGIRKFLYAHTQTCLTGAMPGIKALNAARIPIMLIKGAARIARNPAAAQERLIRDVDLLVPFDEKSRAFEVLHGRGWGFKPSEQWQGFWRGADETNHHAWAVAKGNAVIDLHHHSNVLNRLIGDDAGLWTRARTQEWRGLTLLVPTVTDNLLISIVHGVRWSMDNGADWAIDASASIDEGGVDWSVFVQEVELRRLHAISVVGLNYLRDALHKAVPADVVSQLQRSITPMQLSEKNRYTTYATSRNFDEVDTAYAMARERLRAQNVQRGASHGKMHVDLPFVPNEPHAVGIVGTCDCDEYVDVTVRLQTTLPAGTRLLGTMGILGLLMDRAVAETGSGGTCDMTFSIFAPLLKARGINRLLFISGVVGEATPLYWNKSFTA